MNPIAHATAEYRLAVLKETDLDPDPIRQFGQWLETALQARVPEPSAMTLATATPEGVPSARIVLLKDFGESGFTFYTNYQSQKGRELEANPRAALLFYWPTLERQIRILGSVTFVSRDESKAYFHSRPVGSQVGAWASHQSEVLASRTELDERYHRLTEQYEGKEVPLPPHWGGYRLAPSEMEFWQGGNHRLHDRFRYRRVPGAGWKIDRLYP